MQQQNQLPQSTSITTNNFTLQATLTPQPQTLTLTLQYLPSPTTPSTIYTNTYTPSNMGVGTQIHRKMDLDDIYRALAYGGEGDQADDARKNMLRDYRFGDVFRRGDFGLFKVDLGGKITVYKNVVDGLTGGRDVYESGLVLKKVQDQGKKHEEDLKKMEERIKKVEQKNQSLMTKITNLEKSHKQLQNLTSNLQNVLLSVIQQSSSNSQKIKNLQQQVQNQNLQYQGNRRSSITWGSLGNR